MPHSSLTSENACFASFLALFLTSSCHWAYFHFSTASAKFQRTFTIFKFVAPFPVCFFALRVSSGVPALCCNRVKQSRSEAVQSPAALGAGAAFLIRP